MRELSSENVAAIVGGNLVTGWVPNGWPGLTLELGNVLESIRTAGVRIPGVGFTSVPIASATVIGIVPANYKTWDC